MRVLPRWSLTTRPVTMVSDSIDRAGVAVYNAAERLTSLSGETWEVYNWLAASGQHELRIDYDVQAASC